MSYSYKNPFFSPARAELLIAEYLSGEAASTLAKKYGCSKPCVLSTLERYGCPRRSGNRSRKLNDRAFDDAESNPVGAYYVGLLMADGVVIRRRNRLTAQAEIGLSLKESDRSLLESYREFINSTHAIRINHRDNQSFGTEPVLSLTVSSNYMANSLERYGVTPRKSFTAKVDLLEDNPDFWRGMVDGDGWLSISESAGVRKPVIGLTGSWDSIIQFQRFCQSTYPSRAKIHPNTSVWRLALSCRPAYMLIQRLYSGDGPALSRKKAIAKTILREFSHFTQPQRWEEKRELNRDDLLNLLRVHGSWEVVARHLGISTPSFRKVRRRLGVESQHHGPVYYRLIRGNAKFHKPGRKV